MLGLIDIQHCIIASGDLYYCGSIVQSNPINSQCCALHANSGANRFDGASGYRIAFNDESRLIDGDEKVGCPEDADDFGEMVMVFLLKDSQTIIAGEDSGSTDENVGGDWR